MLFKKLLAVATLWSTANAAARTSPPAGAIVVAKSGGQFKTVQAAVDSIPTKDTSDKVIFIQPGTYTEQVLVPKLAGKLTIFGYTKNDQDFNNNQVTITFSKGSDEAGNNDKSGTLRVQAASFAAYNLNVIQARGEGVQAIALSAQGGNQAFYGCKFVGYQDTVLANEGKQVYNKCYIEGAIDFIFGQRAVAWFEKPTIAVNGRGYITASGRDSSSNPGYYVLSSATVIVKPGVSLPAGSTYLGRPWRNFARVVWQNSKLDAVVNSAGWSVWGPSSPQTDNVFYREFANTGAGAEGQRASFSSKLGAQLTFGEVVGKNDWVDMNYWNGV